MTCLHNLLDEQNRLEHPTHKKRRQNQQQHTEKYKMARSAYANGLSMYLSVCANVCHTHTHTSDEKRAATICNFCALSVQIRCRRHTPLSEAAKYLAVGGGLVISMIGVITVRQLEKNKLELVTTGTRARNDLSPICFPQTDHVSNSESEPHEHSHRHTHRLDRWHGQRGGSTCAGQTLPAIAGARFTYQMGGWLTRTKISGWC